MDRIGCPYDGLTFPTRRCYLHRIEFPSVQASANRRVVFAELTRFGLVRHLQSSQPKSSIRRNYRTIEKKFACVKVLLEISAVLVH